MKAPGQLMAEYKEIFGTEPGIMGIGDDLENIFKNIEKAIETRRPLWTFYGDKDPDQDTSIDI